MRQVSYGTMEARRRKREAYERKVVDAERWRTDPLWRFLVCVEKRKRRGA